MSELFGLYFKERTFDNVDFATIGSELYDNDGLKV